MPRLLLAARFALGVAGARLDGEPEKLFKAYGPRRKGHSKWHVLLGPPVERLE